MEIKHDLTCTRFVMLNGEAGEAGNIVYNVKSDGNLSAVSVRVAPELQGQGTAGALLDALVCHARKHGLKIFPVCPYVVKKFAQHPDKYADVTGSSPPEK